MILFFFFNDTATTEIYTLSLHDALPIWLASSRPLRNSRSAAKSASSVSKVSRITSGIPEKTPGSPTATSIASASVSMTRRSEEHTSELQSRQYLVCRLLLEKKKKE